MARRCFPILILSLVVGCGDPRPTKMTDKSMWPFGKLSSDPDTEYPFMPYRFLHQVKTHCDANPDPRLQVQIATSPHGWSTVSCDADDLSVTERNELVQDYLSKIPSRYLNHPLGLIEENLSKGEPMEVSGKFLNVFTIATDHVSTVKFQPAIQIE